uniref:Uncharacterized protein n=1 Tax=Anguilla anguilla TaxID=7936 RepID=A0A0E9SVE6_ANGAN
MCLQLGGEKGPFTPVPPVYHSQALHLLFQL